MTKYGKNTTMIALLEKTMVRKDKIQMALPTVTFETKCWEGDWRLLLTTGRVKKMIERCRYPFAEKVLYINNVKDKKKVFAAASKLVRNKILTSVFFVEDLAQQALDHLKVGRDSFKGGFYYSIQELTGIFNCRTAYLLHFSGDSMIENNEPWIDQAIGRMETDSSILAANPNWDRTGQEAGSGAVSGDGLFYRGSLFSDQCYLIRAADFKRPIYNETNAASSMYPDYAGELFEKRVFSYMRNHGLYRLTSKKAFYKHRNFPDDPVRRILLYLTGINLKKGRNRSKAGKIPFGGGPIAG